MINKIKNKIKLVIWDLDETFWKGTLSEEGIVYNTKHHSIVIELTKRGIVNSICSKNERESVEKVLIENDILNYFVFTKIEWKAKGEIIKSLIDEMQLRDENVLFIDDNLGNLNEVLFYCPNISAIEPKLIDDLLSSEFLLGKDDRQLSRLEQYKVLEKKSQTKINSGISHLDFLKSSNIQVSISTEPLLEINRIYELISRTNQLNFTKRRPTIDVLNQQIKTAQSVGFISVSDNFGDYGICGFYLIDNDELIHFVFSCRILNMGIENFLYQKLGEPKLIVNGDVAVDISDNIDVTYISLSDNVIRNRVKTDDNKLLLIGGCDLDQVVHYLDTENIKTEFNYVNKDNISIHKEHTEFLLASARSKSKLSETLADFPIYSTKDINSQLFSEEWDILVYSPLNDFSRGLYKHKKTGILLPFDSMNIDWTNSKNWINLPVHLKNISIDTLELLANNFEFMGGISSLDFERNIKILTDMFPSKKIIILTGSEINVAKCKEWDLGMELRHKNMNEVLKKLSVIDNVELVESPMCFSEHDLSDSIRHYKKKNYWIIAMELNRIINKLSGVNINRNIFIQSTTFLKLSLKYIIKNILRTIKSYFIN